jgi:hypothetical protein
LFLLATYNKDLPVCAPLTSNASIIQRELKMLKPIDTNDHKSAIMNVLSYLELYRLSKGFDRLGEVPAIILM